MICFIIVFTIILANLFLLIVFPMHQKMKHEHYDVCIVLGSPSKDDGSCSRIQKSRMKRAIALYNAHKVDILLITGGCVCNTYSEASVMMEYALSMNVKKEDILLEEHAKNTYDNLLYSKKICDFYHYHKIIVVTSNFHIRRASFFVHKFFDDYAMAGTKEKEKYKHYISEYIRMWNTLRIEFLNFIK